MRAKWAVAMVLACGFAGQARAESILGNWYGYASSGDKVTISFEEARVIDRGVLVSGTLMNAEYRTEGQATIVSAPMPNGQSGRNDVFQVIPYSEYDANIAHASQGDMLIHREGSESQRQDCRPEALDQRWAKFNNLVSERVAIDPRVSQGSGLVSRRSFVAAEGQWTDLAFQFRTKPESRAETMSTMCDLLDRQIAIWGLDWGVR